MGEGVHVIDTRQRLFYLIGPPGSGKSTLMEELTRHCARYGSGYPFANLLMTPGGQEVLELGQRRALYPGTDALSMNVQPRVLAAMERMPYRLMIGEGDRLGGVSFLAGAMQRGWFVHLAALHVNDAMLERRYAQRGSAQNKVWIAGRKTKVQNTLGWAQQMEHDDPDAPIAWIYLHGEDPIEGSVETLLRRWPWLEALRGDRDVARPGILG